MKSSIRDFFRRIGPGFITGASDDDPSGIATYTQAGARFGFGQLWTALAMFPLMLAVQEMVARIGMVAGEGIAAIVRKRFPRVIGLIFVFLLLVANTINIGADIGAMADVAHLMVPALPVTYFAIFFAILILFLEIFLTYQVYARVLKWLALSLLSYVATLLVVNVNWGQLLYHLVVPHFEMSTSFVLGLVALLGTTISPYLFIWQANEEVEEEIAEGRGSLKARLGATKAELRSMRWDTAIGMGFSQLVTFCIIGTAATTFFRFNMDIQSSTQAAQVLAPLVGGYASLIYSLGIIGTGLLAIPVLSASAAYALSEMFNWTEGLGKRFIEARAFYAVIMMATLIGVSMNFLGFNPIQALIWAAVINGVITPVILGVIMIIANSSRIMGQHKNGWLANTVGGLALALMTVCVILLFVL